jgi:hypothetical protein
MPAVLIPMPISDPVRGLRTPEYDLLYDLDNNGGIGVSDFGIYRRFFGLPPGPSGLAGAGSIPWE